ncbi:hypothetical protein AUC68_05285 [Methyloceanibacter methanicus]|uniref:Hydroxymethylbilane synthase n=2 Tax=Methyloceanibacter methanicus TaxID=1774968 RepID=A0A1E3W2M5_9HYPH|nr:hypothetical protein AUC68_05285 [Methyloceanibacter methanicus]
MALAQTEEVLRQLKLARPQGTFEKVLFDTKGDRDTTSKLVQQGGKGGAFVSEIRDAVRRKELHAAMHSLKDIPGNEETPDLTIGAYLQRDTAHDCLVLRADRSEADLSSSAATAPLTIGSTSVRRAAFLRHIYPGCETIHFRGSVVGSEKSRLFKLDNQLPQETEDGGTVGPADALVLAASGLKRVNQDHRIERVFSTSEMLPAVGQGVVVVECRSDDYETLELLASVDHFETRQCALAERELLWILNGHCNSPIAGICEMDDGELRLRAAVMSLDGRKMIETEVSGEVALPRELGREAAFQLLGKGAGELIEASRL